MERSLVTAAQPYNEIYRFTKKSTSVAIEAGHSITPYSLDPTMAGDAALAALRVCHFGISAVELFALWLQMRVFPFKPIDFRRLQELKNKKL